MAETNRDGARWSGDQAEDGSRSWEVDRVALWTWMADALLAVAAPRIGADDLKALCAHVLDTHAPAVLVHGQAAGIALEHLVTARLVSAYVDRYGCAGYYDLQRLRTVARQLRDSAAVRG